MISRYCIACGLPCGESVSKSLSVRRHVRPFCGSMADRDENAARNILHAGHHTVLSEFRARLVAGNSEQLLLDTMLALLYPLSGTTSRVYAESFLLQR